MKFFLTQFIKTPMLLVFLFMTLIFGLGALGKTAEIEQFAIVTAIGIDTIDEEENNYEVSFMTLIPVAEQNFTERYKIVSAKGRNVSEAIDFAGLNIGRQVGLSHLKIIVLSQELIREDLYNFLDYLARTIQLSLSTKVVATHDDTAKSFLETAQQLDSESSIKVSELIAFNSDYIYSTDSSLETFFKGSFGPTKVGLMACLTTQNGGTQVLETMSSNGSSMGGESSGSNPESNITQCHIDIFKDGKFVMNVDGKEIKKLNFVRGDYSTGSIEINHFTDKYFDDADVTFEIFGKKQKLNVTYQNGIPVVQIDTKLTLRLSEVKNKGGILKENVEFFAISEEAVKAVEQKVKNSMSDGLTIMREHQIDLADFYTFLFNNNKKAFKNFLSSLEDEEDYLNHIVFRASIKVYAK